MLECFPVYIINLLSRLLYSVIHIKEEVSKLCGYHCKFTEAGVKGYADLSFLLNHTPYRIRFKRQLGPPSYTRIENEDGDLVTNDVAQFAGPCRNFYGVPTTPRILGFESLKVFFRSGKTEIFLGNDPIILEK